MTHPVLQGLRRIARRLGVNRVVGRWMARSGYERRFTQLFLVQVRPGDVAWDIGANVGVYTSQLADLVGPAGLVVAFEPNPRTAARLHGTVAGRRNVEVVAAAIGAIPSEMQLLAGPDELGAASRLVARVNGEGATGIRVRVISVDHLVWEQGKRPPDVIKIDVEGFELQVLSGMQRLLREAPPRLVAIEVHFTLLEASGERNAPRSIEALLLDAGYGVQWSDPSHIVARR